LYENIIKTEASKFLLIQMDVVFSNGAMHQNCITGVTQAKPMNMTQGITWVK